MSNFQEFIDKILTDKPVSPARYSITITGSPSASSDITINCASVSIPGLNILTTQDRRTGISETKAFPDGKEFSGTVLSFYETESFNAREYFSNWMNSMYNPRTKRLAFFDNIKKTLQINQLDRENNIIYSCKLLECFPTHISDLNRAAASQGNFELMSVSLLYHEFVEIFYKNGLPVQPSFPGVPSPKPVTDNSPESLASNGSGFTNKLL